MGLGLSDARSLSGLPVGARVRPARAGRRMAGRGLPRAGGLGGLGHLLGQLVVGIGGVQAPFAGGAGLVGAVGACLGPVALVFGAVVSADQVKILLAALDDAAKYKRDRAGTCADCAGQPCTTCQWRLQTAGAYDQLAEQMTQAAEAPATRPRAPGHAAPGTGGPPSAAGREAGQ